MKQLEINESTVCQIHANQEWNRTGVVLVENNVYLLETVGNAVWKDFLIVSGPEGFTRWYLQWSAGRKRMADKNWFALIGTYNQQMPFLIGKGIPTLLASMTGELMCYANDVPGFYWNNSGTISLKITRLAE